MGLQSTQHVGNILFCHSFQRLHLLILFPRRSSVLLHLRVRARVRKRLIFHSYVCVYLMQLCARLPLGSGTRGRRRTQAATTPAYGLDLRHSSLLKG